MDKVIYIEIQHLSFTENFSKNEMKNLTNKINLKSNQHIFFSKIIYSDHLISKTNSIKVSEFKILILSVLPITKNPL